MTVLKLVLGLLVASALVVFGAQNTQSVSFHFLIWDTPSVPVVLAIAIGVLLGVVLSWVASIPGRVRGRLERRTLAREAKAGQGAPASEATENVRSGAPDDPA